jgi:hypothetical protein
MAGIYPARGYGNLPEDSTTASGSPRPVLMLPIAESDSIDSY